jgi:RNA polymerase sigma-70 factor (ECF subfamily)
LRKEQFRIYTQNFRCGWVFGVNEDMVEVTHNLFGFPDTDGAMSARPTELSEIGFISLLRSWLPVTFLARTTPMPATGPEHVAQVQMLFVQHSPALRGFILSLMPDFGRVDDVLQETFLTVSRKAEDFVPGSNFMGWACAIARFKVLEAVRANPHAPQALSEEVLESLCACEPEPEEQQERLKFLADCLNQLAPQARRAVELRYQQAHKPSEIAQIMGWSADAVYVALSRARVVLRECVSRKLGRAS